MNGVPTAILAFRNGSIGNTLVAVPALRAIRKQYPDARLSVVVDPVGHELLEPCSWIDDLIIYDKRGRDRGISAHAALIRRLRRLRPSHAVLFKRFFRNGLLAYLSGADTRAGFATEGRAPFLNLTIPYDESAHIVDLNLSLAELLGAPTEDRSLEVFLTEQDREQARTLAGAEPFIVIHYGGQTTPPDFFPEGKFIALLSAVLQGSMRIFFVGSGDAETDRAQSIIQLLDYGESALNMPVRVTAALIESAALFIGFNSGPAHIAAATGTPELVFFRHDSNTEREIQKWSPVSTLSRVLVPPSPGSEDEWHQFLDQSKVVALELLSSPRAVVHG